MVVSNKIDICLSQYGSVIHISYLCVLQLVKTENLRFTRQTLTFPDSVIITSGSNRSCSSMSMLHRTLMSTTIDGLIT